MYKEQFFKVSLDEINSWTAKLTFSLTFLALVAFLSFWGYTDSLSILGDIYESFFNWIGNFLVVIFLFVLSIVFGSVLHELIHAAFFLPSLSYNLKGLSFGYIQDKMTLYVHLKEPVSIIGFRVGLIMPLIILGAFPIILGLFYGYLSILLFGIVLSVAAVGDLLLLFKTRHLHSEFMIKDQPGDIAILAIEKI